MFCRNCGKEINESSKFCSFCGENVESTKSIVSEVVPALDPVRVHSVRDSRRPVAIVGFVLGIVGLSISFYPFIGVFLSVAGGITSSIGLKSILAKKKAVTGLILSIIGFFLGCLFTYLIIAL